MVSLIGLLKILKGQTINICCQIPIQLYILMIKIACGHLIMKLLEFLPKYKAIELLSMFYFSSDNHG